MTSQETRSKQSIHQMEPIAHNKQDFTDNIFFIAAAPVCWNLSKKWGTLHKTWERNFFVFVVWSKLALHPTDIDCIAHSTRLPLDNSKIQRRMEILYRFRTAILWYVFGKLVRWQIHEGGVILCKVDHNPSAKSTISLGSCFCYGILLPDGVTSFDKVGIMSIHVSSAPQ